jgi:hypothetical protein
VVEAVGDRLADLSLARDPLVLDAQPSLELDHQGPRPLLSDRQALLGRLAVDLALDREQLIDPPYRLGRDRRLADRRELEQFASRVGPARCLEDRPRLPLRLVEPVEPGVGVRLQDAGEFSQVPLGMFASAVR